MLGWDLGAEGLGQGQGELWDLGLSCGKGGILTLRQSLLLALGYGHTVGIQHLDSACWRCLHLCFLWQSHQATIWVDFWNFLTHPDPGAAAGVGVTGIGKGWNFREL